MAGALYGLSVTLPPAAAVAIGVPLGAALYLVLLRRVVPDGFRMLSRPLNGLRRRTAEPVIT
jgi:hypothetical protein